MAWASKGRYFIAAACMLLATALLCFARTGIEKMNYNKEEQTRQKIASVFRTIEEPITKYSAEKSKGDAADAIINKEFEPFKYREVLPLLTETIISNLPNEHNNPKQAELYKAFAKGDVDAIKKIPRERREQIFITGMTIYFTNDLEGAKFGGADVWRRSRGNEPGMEDGGGEYEYAMMMEMEMSMGRGMFNEYSPLGYMGAGTTAKKSSGFVVQALCYSPYGRTVTEVGEIVNPDGVDDQPDKWGFVTRLAHLDDTVEDGNSPFELFKREDHEQFSLEIKEVTIDGEMPEGIGVWEDLTDDEMARSGSNLPIRSSSVQREWILIDPMTKETISKEKVLDENGKQILYRGQPRFKVNDHWFVLNAKFVWRDAPEPPKPETPQYGQYGGIMPRRPTPSTSTAPSTSSGSSGRSLPDVE